MAQTKARIFYDSSVIHYGSGQIGYRWAVKVCYTMAANLVHSLTDALMFQDILDWHAHHKNFLRGEQVFCSSKKLVNEIVPVEVEDFDRSMQLHQKYPQASPRLLLRVAVMQKVNCSQIAAGFASEIEKIPEIERVNLMDKVEDFEKICHRF